MRFYDREQEMTFLRETRVKAETAARFTVVTGRRRIGKTTLIREAYKDAPFVYNNNLVIWQVSTPWGLLAPRE